MKKKILVVDDDREVVDLLAAYLEREGFTVRKAFDGPRAVELARNEGPDLVVLDLMLPGLDGLEVCRRLQQDGIPVLMLTARDEEADKIIGLEMGADDYVTKPFSPREVVARIKAVLRRTGTQDGPAGTIERGGLIIDLVKHRVVLEGREVHLTPTEFELLRTMAAEPGRAFSRLQLIEAVQGHSFEGYERTIDAHVKNLRRKIEKDPKNPRYLVTVFGVGYRFEGYRE